MDAPGANNDVALLTLPPSGGISRPVGSTRIPE
jgi:hypothetical protein